jgi:general secretion pathway protein A
MYQAHFGLEKSLFEGGIAQDAAIFFGARRQLVAANFKVALTTFDSAVILSGPAGIGKTTLASTAVRAISTRLALGWLSTVPANAAELLEFLLVEFGFNAHRVGRVERLQMWRQFLNEMNATESRVFVIVENAEDLAPEVLRALESLTAADPTGCRGANLVLLGRTGLDEHLRSPLLESLRQRVRLRQKLEPFTADELQDYLRHLVTHAGGEFERVFGAGTVAALHQYSGGIARIANNLCETALTLAATSQEPELTPELVG